MDRRGFRINRRAGQRAPSELRWDRIVAIVAAAWLVANSRGGPEQSSSERLYPSVASMSSGREPAIGQGALLAVFGAAAATYGAFKLLTKLLRKYHTSTTRGYVRCSTGGALGFFTFVRGYRTALSGGFGFSAGAGPHRVRLRNG